MNVSGIDPEAMEYLCRYQWKGNIRELENVVQYMISMNSDSVSGIMGVSALPAQVMEMCIRDRDASARFLAEHGGR